MKGNSKKDFFAAFKGFFVAILIGGGVVAIGPGLTSAAGAETANAGWGSFHKPFSADSPWNSRPVTPVLGNFVIPKSNYYPLIGAGKYSLGVFLAKVTDGPITIYGIPGSKGLWDPDAEIHRDSITIPHWPAEATPAAGSDGHADIVDPSTGIVHSLFKLKWQDGRWVAMQYAWTRIDGRGWGDPAHYFQGARAAAVPSMGGLIRKHEVNDGEPIYKHALAVSLTFNALSAKPAYVFPATSADGNAASTNSGSIPQGALLMLPESFDTQGIADPALRKVADTLKTYGAYVVDRNVGTPFYIYVEIGAAFNLHPKGWNNTAAAELDRIRLGLRPVLSAESWIDGNGRSFVPERNLNLLSMRGPWRMQAGTTPGVYHTWAQAVVFRASSSKTVQVSTTTRLLNPVEWAKPAPGAPIRLTARTSGGGKLRLQIMDGSTKSTVFDSGELEDGDTATFKWPSPGAVASVYTISGVGQVSSVSGELISLNR